MRFFKADQGVRSVEDEVAAVRLMAIANRSKGRDPYDLRDDTPPEASADGEAAVDDLQ
jgi:hypothetical protein